MNKSLITAVAIFAILLIGGIFYFSGSAKADESNSTCNGNSIMQQAVENGIISQEQADNLETYTQEQRQQRAQDQMQERIDDALANGTITQDEANQIQEWQANRPDAMEKIGGFRGHGKIGENNLGQATCNE